MFRSFLSKVTRPFTFTHQLDNKRFFMVKYEYIQNMQTDENMAERRKRHLELYEAEDHLLFSGDTNDHKQGFHIMRCLNERKAYEFIQSDPYFQEGLVDGWNIEEMEIPTRTETKELTTRQHLYR